SGGGLDEVFLAIGDEKVAVFIDVANVAGVKPTVFTKNFASGFGIFEVALHDARAFGENFAVFGYSKLNVANSVAATPDAVNGIVGGKHRRSFSKTVALINGNANDPEEFGEFARQRSAAGEDDAELAAGGRAKFGVNQTVG